MCGTRRTLRTAEGPVEGETVRLNEVSLAERRTCQSGGFPWWSLWLLWPLFWLVKGATQVVLPVVTWLGQPLMLQITPLPLLLIGAGLAILVVGALQRTRQ